MAHESLSTDLTADLRYPYFDPKMLTRTGRVTQHALRYSDLTAGNFDFSELAMAPNIELIFDQSAVVDCETGCISGRYIRRAVIELLRTKNRLSNSINDSCALAVILVGTENAVDPRFHAARLSKQEKKKAFNAVGIACREIALPSSIKSEELERIVSEMNQDASIVGTIVQMPVREDLEAAVQSISPDKDIDALTQRRFLTQGTQTQLDFLNLMTARFPVPATSEAAARLAAQFVNPEIDKVLILGSHGFVGNGIVVELLRMGIEPILYDVHLRGQIPSEHMMRTVKGIISTIPSPESVTPELLAALNVQQDMLNVMIDVGFNPIRVNEDWKVQGSIHPDCYVGNIAHTPVPGGIGPLEMAILLQRTWQMLTGEHITWSIGGKNDQDYVPCRPHEVKKTYIPMHRTFRELQLLEDPHNYAIEYTDRGSGTLIMAIHSDTIERFTGEIAAAIAGPDYSLYRLRGQSFNQHISSNTFDEPTAIDASSKAERTVSIHGCASLESFVMVGGLDTELGIEITDALLKIGVDCRPLTEGLNGKNPNNICNRNRKGKGVQLEISKGLRDKLQENPGMLASFAQAVRSVISAEDQHILGN